MFVKKNNNTKPSQNKQNPSQTSYSLCLLLNQLVRKHQRTALSFPNFREQVGLVGVLCLYVLTAGDPDQNDEDLIFLSSFLVTDAV